MQIGKRWLMHWLNIGHWKHLDLLMPVISKNRIRKMPATITAAVPSKILIAIIAVVVGVNENCLLNFFDDFVDVLNSFVLLGFNHVLLD